MKIRTQFIMTMLLFGILMAAISVSAIVTNQRVKTAGERENIALRITQGANELSYLANDYVIYHESQQLERWQIRYASFSTEAAMLKSDNPEQQALIHNIQANTKRLMEVFDSVVSAVRSSPQGEGTIDPAFLRVSWSRIGIQSQSLISDATRLSQLSDTEEQQALRLNNTVVIILIGLFIAYLLVNYLVTQRRVLKGLAKLQYGTAIIGAGNLDFRIEEKGTDEIGELSRAFNRMTADLKMVTASKTDLEKEIEERKKAEAEIVHLASFPQLNPNAVLELDTDCNIQYANPAALKHFPDLMTLGCKHPFLIDIANHIYKGEKQPVTNDVNIGEFWFVQSLTYMSETQSYRLYARDITERKKAEDELKHSEQRWATTLASIGDAVIATDVSSRITFMNAVAEDLTGWKHQDASGRPVTEIFNIINEITRQTVECPVTKVIREGLIVGLANHTILVRKDGTDIPIDDSGAPIKGEGGITMGVVLVFRDITERRKAEKMKDEFIGMVSHELKTPITVVMGGIHTAMAEGVSQEEVRDLLEDAAASADSLASIVDNLLELSRAQANRLIVRKERIDVGELARDVIRKLKGKSAVHRFIFDIPDRLLEVQADRLRLERILNNLLDNAVKYSPAGGDIVVSIQQKNDHLVIGVKDQGIGISAKDRTRLFQPFERLETTDIIAGVGIGLNVCHRLVEAQGGRIWFESETGKGATFFFTLPLA